MSGEHTHDEIAGLDTAVAILTERVGRLTAQVVTAEAALAALDTRATALAQGPAQDIYDYDYLGKPPVPQTIGRRYTRLDLSGWTPSALGWEHLLYYLNIAPTFYDGKQAGAIRPRLVRASGDLTAYDDIVLHRDALDEDGRSLRIRLYWEAGEQAGSHLELQCIGGLKSAVLTTRYVKRATVKDRG